MIEYENIDKDILDFLRVIYFGDITDPVKAASDRAYRDFNRTLCFNNMLQEKECDELRNDLRCEVTNIFKGEIPGIVGAGVKDPNDYDEWHDGICEKICKTYQDANR